MVADLTACGMINRKKHHSLAWLLRRMEDTPWLDLQENFLTMRSPMSLRIEDFDFDLPEQLIAQQPTPERDQSRLMLVEETALSHHRFWELPALLLRQVGPGAVVVFNDTKVLPARLYTRKVHPHGTMGGRVELLLCEELQQETTATGWRSTWRCLAKGSKSLRPGTLLQCEEESAPRAEVVCQEQQGRVQVVFWGCEPEGWLEVLTRLGHMPLPPYIRKGTADSAYDNQRYQTVFATQPGAIAAPTAGLHFTPALLEQLDALGFVRAKVTLHVGLGTFSPIQQEDITQHKMHTERYNIPTSTVQAIVDAKREGRKVIAIGTTVLRALESATLPGNSVPSPGSGETSLFVYPPYSFRVVDALLTNFHLPRSTLLLLVAACIGTQRLLSAYQTAIDAGYRFFSYGDAMLIPRFLPST